METAAQLDSKFLPNIFNAEMQRELQQLQYRNKKNAPKKNGSDNLDMEMMYKIIDYTNPDYEKKLNEQIQLEKEYSNAEKYAIIMEIVSTKSGLSSREIKSHRRIKRIPSIRSIVMFCMRWVTDYSLTSIGKLLSNDASPFDHSTVLHSCQNTIDYIKTKDAHIYPIIVDTIIQLRNQGIDIDWRNNPPKWFKDGMKK